MMTLLGEVVLDGRRVQVDAALELNRTRDQIEEEFQEILDEAADIDEEEDEEHGPENRGDELLEELKNKESRLKRLREAKAKLHKKEQRQKDEQAEKIRKREAETESGETMRGRKPKPPEDVKLDDDTKANKNDPESQTMKSHAGWKQGYNGQAMVDYASQVFVAKDVITDANDKQQLEPMLEEYDDVNGKVPSKVLANAVYRREANSELEDE